MYYKDQDALIAFLLSDQGRPILREAAAKSGWLVEEILDAHKTTPVIVKVYRDGLTQVYGPHRVRARIFHLGRSVTFPEHEIAVERVIDECLPQPFLRYHFARYKRAEALR